MSSFKNSLCCNYFDDGGAQWQIQVRSLFINISCPKRHVGITLLVDKEKGEKEITYNETEPEYKCGADVIEGYFESDDTTLTIGVRRYVDFEKDDDENGAYEVDEDGEPVEDAYAELMGRRFRSQHFMPVQVARILMAIAKDASIEELKELRAQHIRLLS
jgi:hypothetical protein